jgi:hypothetical protein
MHKRNLLLVLLAIICLNIPNYCKAESGLNGNEDELIDYFQQGIEYEGKHYSIPKEYINQGINYLNQEGVDISDEQKAKVYAKVVEMTLEGIRQGYLVLDEPQTPAAEQEAKSTNDVSQNDPSTVVQDTDLNELINNPASSSLQENNSQDTVSINISNTEKKSIPELINSVKDLSDDLGVKVSYDAANNKINIVNGAGNKVMVSDKTIKNTGFRLNQTIAILGCLLIMTGVCNQLAHKYHLFAHEDET